MSKIDDLIRIMDINEITLWTVTKGTGDNNKVFETSDHVTLDERKNKFREVMKLYPGGNFVLVGKRAKTDTRGMFRLEFDNLEDAKIGQMNNAPAPVTITGVPADEVERRISEAIARNDEKRELKELRDKTIELEKQLREADNVTNRIMKKVEPYIGTVIPFVLNKFIPSAQIQVAGIQHVEDDTVEDVTETESSDYETQSNETDRLQNALEIWAKADPDFIDLIETIANMASTKDAMYAMAKNMLKK